MLSFKGMNVCMTSKGLPKDQTENNIYFSTHLLVSPEDLASERSLLAHIQWAPVYQLLRLWTAHLIVLLQNGGQTRGSDQHLVSSILQIITVKEEVKVRTTNKSKEITRANINYP